MEGRRHAVMILTATATAALVCAAAGAGARGADGHHRTVGFGQTAFDFAGPEKWAARYRREHRKVVALRHELRATRRLMLHRPQVREAVNLAATVYGFGSTLWRKANCETGGTFSPTSYNSSSGASGLFQFLPSTWRSTPFGSFSVWSPYANALAAGWMHQAGRGGEWVCR